MIGIKQLVGVAISLALMASGAVLQGGDVDGAVALKTLEEGGTQLVARAPAGLFAEDLHVFSVQRTGTPLQAPTSIEGAVDQLRLVASTEHPAGEIRLGTQSLRVPQGATVSVEGFQGSLTLNPAELGSTVDLQGVARTVSVEPPAGAPVSTTLSSPAGLPAQNVLLDGTPVRGAYTAGGEYATITANLLPGGPNGTGYMATNGGTFPIEEQVRVELFEFVGVVATVKVNETGVLLALEGYAEVLLDGQPVIDRGTHRSVKVGPNGISATNPAPTANFSWRPTVPQAGDEVQFMDRSSDDLFVRDHHWVFGDGSQASTERNPTHVFRDPGTYPVTLTVTDAEGKSASKTVDLHVDIKRPEIIVSWNPIRPVEEQDTQFSAQAQDANGDPVQSIEWTFPSRTASGGEVVHAFATEGDYDVSVKATDKNGVPGWSNHTVHVANAPPDPSFTVDPLEPVAGETATLTSTSTDRAGGTITNTTWEIQGIDEPFYGEQISVAFVADGPQAVRLTVTDNDGDQASITEDVQVANPPPKVTIQQDPIFPNPGETVTFTALVEDDDTPARATWTLPGGVQRDGLAINHQFQAGGTYEIKVEVEDADGALGEAFHTATVNHAPEVTLTQTDDVVLTFENVTFEASVSDPEGNSTTLKWVINGAIFGHGSTLTHNWNDDGNRTIQVTVTDDNGASTVAATSVLVLNRPPSLNPQVEGVANRGQPAVLVSGASDLDGSITEVRWFEDGERIGTGKEITHTFQKAGTHELEVEAQDNDGAIERATFIVDVNSAPTLSICVGTPEIGTFCDPQEPVMLDAGTLVTFSATTSDPDGDNVTVKWNFGDGQSATGDTVHHAYAEAGAYVVRAHATDEHNFGVRESADLDVQVPDLDSSLSITPTQPDDGDTVTFTVNLPSGRSVEEIRWSFGDGTTRTTGQGVDSVDHVYNSAEHFPVEVALKADHGSKAVHTATVRVVGSYDQDVRLAPLLPDGQCVNLDSPKANFSVQNLYTGSKVTVDQGANIFTREGSCTLTTTFAAGSWSRGDGLRVHANVGAAEHVEVLSFSLTGLLQDLDYELQVADVAFDSFQVVPRARDARIGQSSQSQTTFHDPTEQVYVDGVARWAEGTALKGYAIDLQVTYHGPLPLDPVHVTYHRWTVDTAEGGIVHTPVPMPVVNPEGDIVVEGDHRSNNVAFPPGQYSVTATVTSSAQGHGFFSDQEQVLFIQDPEGIFKMFEDAGIPV